MLAHAMSRNARETRPFWEWEAWNFPRDDQVSRYLTDPGSHILAVVSQQLKLTS